MGCQYENDVDICRNCGASIPHSVICRGFFGHVRIERCAQCSYWEMFRQRHLCDRSKFVKARELRPTSDGKPNDVELREIQESMTPDA